MFEALTIIPHDIGTAVATWGIMVALWAAFAAGLLNAAKENDACNV